jgi:hypothetical protein
MAKRGGGGKGLIIGLGAIGAVLLIGIVVVAAQQLKPKEDDQPLTSPFGSGSAQTTIAPQVDDGTAPTASTETVPEESAKPDKTAAPTTTKTSTPAVDTAKACDNCIAAASGGNIGGAARNYAKCTDAGKKATCSLRAKQSAPDAASRAARNGNCAQAKAIIGAANSMGAGSPRLSGALSGTKCQ